MTKAAITKANVESKELVVVWDDVSGRKGAYLGTAYLVRYEGHELAQIEREDGTVLAAEPPSGGMMAFGDLTNKTSECYVLYELARSL